MSDTQFDFDHIPSLRELLGTGGSPGLEYAQICTHNLKRAEQDLKDQADPASGWRLLPQGRTYTIVGPKGHADMCLMRRGKRIPGTDGTSGARKVFVDPDVLKLTGINPNPELLKEATGAGKEHVKASADAARA